MSNKLGNIAVALLTGVAIGAAIGILFAPDKGSKTREKIKDGFDDAKDNLGKFTENIKSKFLNSEMSIDATLQELLADSSNTTDEIIAILEKKLSKLKKNSPELSNN